VNIELYVFGGNANGQLGVPISSIDFVPNQTFSGGINWKQVTAGANSHTAAIKTDGTLWTWGDTSGGRLGNGVTVATSISTPITTFAGGTNWKQVSCGNIHTSAIKTDGTLWTWGFGTNGRLGNAVITGTISTPVTTFAGGTNWKQVSSGFNHTAAVEAGINAEYPLS
jgi:alpha-tubulin suppressor-like RCC1 family protein